MRVVAVIAMVLALSVAPPAFAGKCSPYFSGDTGALDHWNDYARDFQRINRETIVRALSYYRAAKAQGDAHVAFLEELGFVFGPRAEDVRVPTLQGVLRTYERKMQQLVDAGEVLPSEVLRPARVYFNPDKPADARDRIIYRQYGESVPEGYRPMTEIVPVPFAHRMMAEGFVPLGEHGQFVGPAGLDNLINFSQHDLTHLGAFVAYPRYMAALRQAAREMASYRAFFRAARRRVADDFTTEQATTLLGAAEHRQVLLDRGLVTPALMTRYERATGTQRSELLQQIRGKLNELGGERRLEASVLFEIANQTFGTSQKPAAGGESTRARTTAGLRFTLLFETAELVPADKARALRARLQRDGYLPRAEADHRYVVSEVQRYLEAKPRATLLLALRDIVRDFPTMVERYGGASRDIIQLATRFQREPNGFAHYFTMSYLWNQAKTVLERTAPPPTQTELAQAIARLQVAMVESGRVDIVQWARDVSRPTMDRNSEVYKWICQSGAFAHDLFYFAHCH